MPRWRSTPEDNLNNNGKTDEENVGGGIFPPFFISLKSFDRTETHEQRYCMGGDPCIM